MRYLALIFALVACAPVAPPGSVPRGVFDSCDSGIDTPLPTSLAHVYTDRSMCSGVVTSDTEVLTAGHCLEDTTHAYVTHDALDGSIFIVTHAVINGPWGEDVALLRVRTPVIPAPVGAPSDVGLVELAGYGCDKAGRVRQAMTRPRDFPFAHARPVTGCACKGDSGGPVYDVYGSVVGVMTHTDSVSRTYMTDVTVLPFLRDLMRALLADSPEATDPSPQ